MSLDKTNILVLAAGRGIGVDGFHKLNLVYPGSNETILNRYLRQFNAKAKIVVGYRAAEIMSVYIDLDYVYNYKWFETGSAFSASLGIEDYPIIILPSDLVISDEVASQIQSSKGDIIFGRDTENRSESSANISHTDLEIKSIYNGSKLSGNDKEFSGIIKITTELVLNKLRKICEENPSFFLSEALELTKDSFELKVLEGELTEINDIEEYINLFQQNKTNDS